MAAKTWYRRSPTGRSRQRSTRRTCAVAGSRYTVVDPRSRWSHGSRRRTAKGESAEAGNSIQLKVELGTAPLADIASRSSDTLTDADGTITGRSGDGARQNRKATPETAYNTSSSDEAKPNHAWNGLGPRRKSQMPLRARNMSDSATAPTSQRPKPPSANEVCRRATPSTHVGPPPLSIPRTQPEHGFTATSRNCPRVVRSSTSGNAPSRGGRLNSSGVAPGDE